MHEWTIQNTKHKGYLFGKNNIYRKKFEQLKRERRLKRMKARQEKDEQMKSSR